MRTLVGRTAIPGWWGRLTVRKKLLIGIGSILALMVATLVVGGIARVREEAAFERTMTRLLPARALAKRATILVLTVDDLGAWYVMSRDDAGSRRLLRQYRAAVRHLDVTMHQLADLADSRAEATTISQFRSRWQGENGYLHGNETAFRLKSQGKFEDALRSYLAVPYAPSLWLLRSDDEFLSTSIAAERKRWARERVIIDAITLYSGICSVTLAIFFALQMANAVGRRLQHATQALTDAIRVDLGAITASLRAVSQTNFGTKRRTRAREPLIVSGSDEVAALAASYNHLIDNLQEISGEVGELLDCRAHDDGLAGLPGRAELSRRLARAIAGCETRASGIVAIIVADVDGFKKINASLGAAVGDELLKQMAIRLVASAREGDTIARPDGDKFLVLLDAVRDPEHAVQLAQEIIAALERPFDLSGHELYVSVSVGLSIYPKDGREIDELLQNADTAMYQAKALRRRGFASYEPAMRNDALKQLVLETELQRALRADEFEVYYQPIVCIRSGQVVAVEALLRWLHPRLGILQPAAFLGTAEEIGLIVEIGKDVLRTACLQAMAWCQRGLPLRMSVNVSPRQFHREDLHSFVAKILYETGLPPHLLELELTESIIMQDRERASITMRALQQLGVQIAIDDFGTGYSCLEYVHNFPVNTLKIDRSFVREVAKDRRGEAIARTIVLLGRALDLRVIAEGIETIEELSTLRDLGCDEFQGYLVSKPLSAEQCFKFLERRSLTWEWPGAEPA